MSTPQPKREFSDEFKTDAGLITESGKSRAQTARDLGVNVSTLGIGPIVQT